MWPSPASWGDFIQKFHIYNVTVLLSTFKDLNHGRDFGAGNASLKIRSEVWVVVYALFLSIRNGLVAIYSCLMIRWLTPSHCSAEHLQNNAQLFKLIVG